MIYQKQNEISKTFNQIQESSDELRVCFVTKGVKRKLHPGNWNSVTMGSATAPQRGPSLCCLHSGKESQVQMKQTNKAFLGLKGGGWKFCFAETTATAWMPMQTVAHLGPACWCPAATARANKSISIRIAQLFFDHSYTFSSRDSELGRLEFSLLAKSGVHRPKEKEEINQVNLLKICSVLGR